MVIQKEKFLVKYKISIYIKKNEMYISKKYKIQTNNEIQRKLRKCKVMMKTMSVLSV
jgi:hypothetical protein